MLTRMERVNKRETEQSQTAKQNRHGKQNYKSTFLNIVNMKLEIILIRKKLSDPKLNIISDLLEDLFNVKDMKQR